MSSNESVGINETNTTYFDYNYDYTDNFNYVLLFEVIRNVYAGSAIFIIIVGTLLNLWFLVAILCSQSTRSRVRNKIICNSLVLHLVDCVILLPVSVNGILGVPPYKHTCISMSVMHHLDIIQDFIGNWLLVMLLAVFIAQIKDFNPKMKLLPRTITLGTVGLLVVPWIASLVLVPVIVHVYHKPWMLKDCVFPTLDAKELIKTVDTTLPILLAVLLLVVAVFLRYRRFTRGYSSRSMQTELISRGPEIDSSLPYIVATAISTFCDILYLIYIMNGNKLSNLKLELILMGVSFTVRNFRAVLMPLPWLLLPDIRQQIKTWRPWSRPSPGIDLTVTYRREEEN